MRTIWKFEISEITDRFSIDMPSDAEILTVQVQNGNPCIWAIVESEHTEDRRYFEIIGTGHPFKEDRDEIVERKYIGTFQLYGGGIIFHLFERL